MNKIIKSLACIAIALSLIVITSCDNTRGSKPMLKLTVDKGTFAYYLPMGTDYYIIYENGAAKKTSKFDLSDAKSLRFNLSEDVEDLITSHNIDINTPQGKELIKIINDILLFKDDPKLKIFSGISLHILDDRYFFIAYCDKDNPVSTLFEYFPADNTTIKIAKFNNRINYVQLY